MITFDFEFPIMPLGHDVVAHGKPQTRAFPCGFGGKEGLEDFLSDVIGNATSIVPDRYFHAIRSFLGFYPNLGFIRTGFLFRPLFYGMKGIGKQVK